MRTTSTVSDKAKYSKPNLRVLGSVRELTTAAASGSNEGSMNVTPNMSTSDPALKTNIVRVGEHPLGFGLYLFDYRPEYRDMCGHGRQFGVMADEVETIVPAAVSRAAEGHRVVNYSLLGIVKH